jgi:hypothetical protein
MLRNNAWTCFLMQCLCESENFLVTLVQQ